MSLSNFKRITIDLDREGETLKAGQLVSGRVIAELKDLPMKVTGLRIVALGECVTSWRQEVKDEDGEDHWIQFIGREEYFNLNFYVIGSESSRAIELPVEQVLSYSFSFQLPYDLPSSLEDDNGYVRYSIRAIFERPSNSDCIFQLDYNIDSNYDLNEKPQARKPISEVIDKSFCCFCICPWGKLRATISVPSTGFVSGQSIPVTVHCENSSTVDISKIKVSLEKIMQFCVKIPDERARRMQYIVSEAKCDYPFTTTFEDHVTVLLKVPSGLQPSGLEFCGLITIRYSLIVEVKFSGMHCGVKRRFHILIGTVPLRTSFNANNLGNFVAPSPSAPLLEPSTFNAAPPSYGSV